MRNIIARITLAAVMASAAAIAPARADQTLSRDAVVKAFERTCYYYDQRTRAGNSIAPLPGKPHFAEPLLAACETIRDGGWLTDPDLAGSQREQVAAHFTLRGALVLDQLYEVAFPDFGQSSNDRISVFGYNDTTLYLALRHERVFRIARDIQRVAGGARLMNRFADAR